MEFTHVDANGKEFDPAKVVLPLDVSQRIWDILHKDKDIETADTVEESETK